MIAELTRNSLVYRLWQSPFAEQKFAPVARVLRTQRPRSVLDIGCGPGTNAGHFREVQYVGVDIEEAYIHSARRRFGDRFVLGDATHELPRSGAPYDFILLNSLMHHLDDGQVDAVLGHAAEVLAPGGAIHILDLELPDEQGLPRFLARHDRGDFPRRREAWQVLLGRSLSLEVFEPYALTVGRRPLWKMFYCLGAVSRVPG